MFPSITLTLGIAALAGTLAMVLARRLGIPQILLLLGTGAILGRSGLGIVDTPRLGQGLSVFVELAVATILFEGALTLRWSEFRKNAAPIRNLVTVGALVTFVGATVVARFTLGVSLSHAALIGAILIVTGPTVVGPLLKFVRPRPALAEILRWEAILIDPIGALVGVVLLEAVLVGGNDALRTAAQGYVLSFGAGTAIGVSAALTFEQLLRRPGLVDEELRSPLALGFAFMSFALAQSLVDNSGLFAVTTAGLTVAARQPPGLEEIEHFKGRLTSFILAILFVLLAALMDLSAIAAIGSRIVAFLGGLFLVRLLSVFIATLGCGLEFRERLFLAWIAPRGVVAAAVASMFAQSLAAHGDASADEIRTAIFCVIVGTVVIQGLTAKTVVRLLGVAAPEPKEVVIVGAGPLGNQLARELARAGLPVTLVDKDARKLASADAAGVHCLAADAQDRRTLEHCDPARVAFVVAATPNDEANALICSTFESVLGRARVSQLPSGSTALALGGKSAATQYPFSFGSELTLELLEGALANGGQLRAFKIQDGGSLDALRRKHGDEFEPLVAIGASGVPIRCQSSDARLEPNSTLVGVEAQAQQLRTSMFAVPQFTVTSPGETVLAAAIAAAVGVAAFVPWLATTEPRIGAAESLPGKLARVGIAVLGPALEATTLGPAVLFLALVAATAVLGVVLARRLGLGPFAAGLAGVAVPLLGARVESPCAAVLASSAALLLVLLSLALDAPGAASSWGRRLGAALALGGAVALDPAATVALPATLWLAAARGRLGGPRAGERAIHALAALGPSLVGVAAAWAVLIEAGWSTLPVPPSVLHWHATLEAGAQLVTGAAPDALGPGGRGLVFGAGAGGAARAWGGAAILVAVPLGAAWVLGVLARAGF